MESIYSKILDKKTGKIIKAYNFGGPDIIQVQDILVYGNKYHNMLSYTKTDDTLILHPIEESINIKPPKSNWTVISHQDINTCNWRVTVKNLDTDEVKSGVYPFNLEGHVYQLDCTGEWVMASCGGKSIEVGSGDLCYTLIGTGETIKTYVVSFRYLGVPFFEAALDYWSPEVGTLSDYEAFFGGLGGYPVGNNIPANAYGPVAVELTANFGRKLVSVESFIFYRESGDVILDESTLRHQHGIGAIDMVIYDSFKYGTTRFWHHISDETIRYYTPSTDHFTNKSLTDYTHIGSELPIYAPKSIISFRYNPYVNHWRYTIWIEYNNSIYDGTIYLPGASRKDKIAVASIVASFKEAYM